MIQLVMEKNENAGKAKKTEKRKLILVTNDDGVHSPGIKILLESMAEIGEAIVVAPDRERSAVSHALTLHRPLRVEQLKDNVYSVNGTPTDCVALGAQKILPRKPDLIVSGINKGANLGDDVTYSGTVSAAIEGAILGIPSMAFSLMLDFPSGGQNGPRHFATAGKYAGLLASFVFDNGLPYDTLLNVNVPNFTPNDVKGVRFTRQSKRVYDGAIQEIRSPWGELCYWIGGGTPVWERGPDTDMETVMDGYVSITPIHLDFTNSAAIDWLKGKWNGNGR